MSQTVPATRDTRLKREKDKTFFFAVRWAVLMVQMVKTPSAMLGDLSLIPG